MASKITYRDLFDMLKRDGCTSITMPMSDFNSFEKYAKRAKYFDELKFEKLNGAFVVTKIKTNG